MARMTVQGTPYSKTVQPQYQGGGINTASDSGGTPARSQAGNPATAKRVVSADTYGKVMSGNQGNANDPMANGAGIVLDGAPVAGSLDSPVPGNAPVFHPAYMDSENKAHLGSGNEAAANSTMTAGDGVLARG